MTAVQPKVAKHLPQSLTMVETSAGRAQDMFTRNCQIVVHAGSHCCGAEEFQAVLGANRRALAEAGLDMAYPGRGGAEGGSFDCAFPEPRHQFSDICDHVAAIGGALAAGSTGADRFLISEHDLPGRMAGLLGGRFYPAARQRAEALRAALGRPVDRLVLVVKPYDTLFVSAWRRFALDRPMEPFAEYAQGMANFTGGWIEVVEALRDGLDARHVTVLAERPAPIELFAHLLPGFRLPSLALPAPAPEITESAIAMIQRHYRQGGRFAAGQRDRILAFHARQPQNPREASFAGLPLADLRGRFVADLDAIARMRGVEAVGNLLPAMAAE